MAALHNQSLILVSIQQGDGGSCSANISSEPYSMGTFYAEIVSACYFFTLTGNIALCAGTLCKSKHRFSERYVESVPLDLGLLFQNSNKERHGSHQISAFFHSFIYFLWPVLQLLLIFTLLCAQSKPSSCFLCDCSYNTQTHARESERRDAEMCTLMKKECKERCIKTAAVCIAIISQQPAPQLRSSFDCFSNHYSSRLVNGVELFLHKLTEQHYKHAWNDSQILFFLSGQRYFVGRRSKEIMMSKLSR